MITWFKPPQLAKDVVLIMKSGQTMAGVVWEMRGKWVLLKGASLVQGDKVLPLDGDIVVAQSDVLLYQIKA